MLHISTYGLYTNIPNPNPNIPNPNPNIHNPYHNHLNSLINNNEYIALQNFVMLKMFEEKSSEKKE
jgi:hypothetical protein